jgi:polyisoprenoid-binding protein YceI
MPARRLLPALAALVLIGSMPLSARAADTYVMDPAHSSIGFSVRHMVISKVHGTFDDFDCSITADLENLENSSVDVTIQAKSINTRNEKRDGHLRSEDFLFAQKYPTLTFRSSAVRKQGDGYIAHGTLTIRGVAKEIDLPFRINGPVTSPGGDKVMGVEIEYTLNRQDYGVNWNRTLDGGGVLVGDEVDIEINLEMKKS